MINETILKRIIKRNPQLRVLIIPNKATENVLKEIKNLKRLKMLDISGNNQLTFESISYISSESLQVLAIGNSIVSNLDFKSMASILSQLPNLKKIKTYQYIGKALMSMKSSCIFKLKAVKDYKTTKEEIETIISMCPDLEEISLESPDSIIFDYLKELRSLKKLKISYYKDVELNLRQLTLETLKLNFASLNTNKLCLTIENLQLKSCYLCCHSINNIICFRNLKIVELVDCNIEHKSIVLYFLECGEQIQRFTMSSDIGLTDSDIKLLCQNKKLKNLEIFWLSMAKQLTGNSVIMLMNHCDKLTCIGTLNGWNIDREEVNYLRCIIYFGNIDLQLLYFSCF